jgi:hypothetical protein
MLGCRRERLACLSHHGGVLDRLRHHGADLRALAFGGLMPDYDEVIDDTDETPYCYSFEDPEQYDEGDDDDSDDD